MSSTQQDFTIQKGLAIKGLTSNAVLYIEDFGAGNPPTSLNGSFGNNGDFAINAINGEIYTKSAGSWSRTGISLRVDGLAVGMRIIPKMQYLTDDDVSGFSGLGPHSIDGQSITFTTDDRVISTYDDTVYLATAGLWAASTADALENKDAFFVGITLPDTVYQRGTSFWQYTEDDIYPGGFIDRIADFDFELADTIGFNAYSPPSSGSATAVSGSGTIQDGIGNLDTSISNILTAIGIARTDLTTGSFTAYGPTGQTVKQVFQSLIDRLRGESSQTSVTTAVTLDSLAAATVRTITWDVEAIQNGSAANRYASSIRMTTNGTDVSYSEFGVVTLGSALTGLTFTVDINGSNVRLRVSSTTSIDVKSIRRTIQ